MNVCACRFYISKINIYQWRQQRHCDERSDDNDNKANKFQLIVIETSSLIFISTTYALRMMFSNKKIMKTRLFCTESKELKINNNYLFFIYNVM